MSMKLFIKNGTVSVVNDSSQLRITSPGEEYPITPEIYDDLNVDPTKFNEKYKILRGKVVPKDKV